MVTENNNEKTVADARQIKRIRLTYEDIELNISQTKSECTEELVRCLKEIFSFTGTPPEMTCKDEVVHIQGSFRKTMSDVNIRYVMLLLANIINSKRFFVYMNSDMTVELRDKQSKKPIYVDDMCVMLGLSTNPRTTATVLSPTGQLVDMLCSTGMLVDIHDGPFSRELGDLLADSSFKLSIAIYDMSLTYSLDGVLITTINYNNLVDRNILEELVKLDKLINQ